MARRGEGGGAMTRAGSRGGVGRVRGGNRGGRGQGRKGGKFAGARKGENNAGGNSGKGPRLSNTLLRAIGVTADRQNQDSDESDKEVAGDVYEYEEEVPEEERGKNKRFDDIDRMEYELPSDFEDEEIDEAEASGGEEKEEESEEEDFHGAHRSKTKKEISLDSDGDDEGSDEEDEDVEEEDGEEEEEEGEEKDEVRGGKRGEINSESSEDEEDEEGDEEDDEERHQRLIEAVTGRAARPDREGRSRKEYVVTEAYPESEFNLNPGASSSGKAPITVQDLMNPLHDATGFGTLRKRMQELQRRGAPVQAPLPKVVQDRVDRQAGYKQTTKDISGWVPIVRRNREAPTLVLNRREPVPALTTATLASTFKATTDFEKEIKNLLNKSKLVEAKDIEEAENLQLNKLTVDEVRERQARLAKMRNLLFRHELKAKRVRKIKSKTYHRLLQKSEKAKAEHDIALSEADPEAAKAAAIKQEFLRAEERMTLKHKNQSRWAKRILKRGLKGEENDGTRDAIADQLRTHAVLTRKIHSATLSSSDDYSSSSDEEEADDDEPTGLILGKANSKVLAKAKVATLKALEEGEEDELPKTGLFAIPFMARAIEKKKKAAEMEAMAVLEQLQQAEVDGDILALHDDYNRLENAEKNETMHRGKISFGDSNRPSESEKEARKAVDELSDVDDSEDERLERAAACAVDMGETALGVPNGSTRIDQSSRKQSADVIGDDFGLDFLANLDRRAFSTGMEDVDVPAEQLGVEHAGKPEESAKCVTEAEPLTSKGIPISVSEEAAAEYAGQHTSNTNDEVLEESVTVKQPGKRRKRKSKKSNGVAVMSSAAISNGNKEVPAEAGQAEKRRKIESNDGTNVEPLRNDGTSTNDEKDEAFVKEMASGHGGKRTKKSRKKSNVGSVTSNGHPDSNGHQDSSVEKIVVGIAGRPTKSATSNGVVEPPKGEAKGERSVGTSNEVSNRETEEDVVAIRAVPSSFSDDDSDHAQEMDFPADLMSQQALIRQAFAGDDVEAEFEQMKAKALDLEAPQGEAPVSLPGWGQWAHVQQRKGQPAWILKEQEKIKKQREDALSKRKDAKLKHVIISEKTDKKASKFAVPSVPFPFKSRGAYERSLRMPIGREYNTDQGFRDKIRPAVIKSAGQIIDPIKRELPSVKEQEAAVPEPRKKRGKK